MRCPVDKKTMVNKEAQGQKLEICPSCFGVWFDENELAHITKNFISGNLENFEKWKDIVVSGKPSQNFWQEPIRDCPKDYTKMQRHTFAGDSKIHIDHCDSCGGFWFDGEDIHRLINYLKPNELQDSVAHAFIKEMQDFEKMKQDLLAIPAKLSASVQSPVYLVSLIFLGIFKLIQKDVEENNF